jgi:L-asparaginase II
MIFGRIPSHRTGGETAVTTAADGAILMREAPEHVPLIRTTRGGFPECVHVGSIAVVDADGRLIAGVGDAHGLNFTRSALKPLQALAFVQDGGMERFGFDSQMLALMCASHGGEAVHVAIVQRMLERIGAKESDLRCGCHPPSYYTHTSTSAPPGARFSQLHHNCSGKHAGFLAFCRLHHQPLARYLELDAPLQQRVRASVERFAGERDLPMGIDGCSAPNYAMPLSSLAHTFCRLALGETPELAALAWAMTRHPDLVSGTARGDLMLMLTGKGDWVSKVGADGVQAIGVRSRGIGIAIRIADGNRRALHVATIAVLRQLGLLDEPAGTPLAKMDEHLIRNYRGVAVGAVEPLFSLPRQA